MFKQHVNTPRYAKDAATKLYVDERLKTVEGTPGPPGPTGATGPQGATGPAGTNGVGVPTGGTVNQVLAKIDSANYNTQWVNQSGGASTSYVDTQDALRVLKAGDTMTGNLTAPGFNPTGGGAFYTSGQYTVINNAAFQCFVSGSTTDKVNYLRNDGHRLQNAAGTVAWFSASAGGLEFNALELHKYNSPGAGGWYDSPTTSQRFFVGTEPGTENFRFYTGGFGNVFVLNGSNGVAQFTNGIQIGNPVVTGLFGDTGNMALRGYATGGIYLQSASGAINYALFNNTGVSITGAMTASGDVKGKDHYASRGDGTGVYYFATGGDKYLYWEGTRYVLSGGPLTADIPGYFPKAGGTVDGSMNVNGNLNIYGGVLYMSTGGHYFQWDGSNYHMPHGNLFILGKYCTKTDDNVQYGTVDPVNSVYGRLGQGGARSNTFTIYWDGRAFLFIDGSNVGQISGVSDYRAKKDVVDLPSMWESLKAVRPISFKYNGWMPPWEMERQKKRSEEEKRTMKPFLAADDMEEWGFIAHELQETLIPSTATGHKDADGIIQAPNSMPLIAMTVRALQEAIARIEIIEGKLLQ